MDRGHVTTSVQSTASYTAANLVITLKFFVTKKAMKMPNVYYRPIWAPSVRHLGFHLNCILTIFSAFADTMHTHSTFQQNRAIRGCVIDNLNFFPHVFSRKIVSEISQRWGTELGQIWKRLIPVVGALRACVRFPFPYTLLPFKTRTPQRGRGVENRRNILDLSPL